MNNRTESVLKDFCKKVSDGTITNPVKTDYDKLFEMLDENIGGNVMSELKNCPFCGEEGVLNSTKEFSNQEYASVNCSKCLVKTMVFSTEKKAIKAWNIRKSESALLTALEDCLTLIDNNGLSPKGILRKKVSEALEEME